MFQSTKTVFPPFHLYNAICFPSKIEPFFHVFSHCIADIEAEIHEKKSHFEEKDQSQISLEDNSYNF
jgi:hypothetical protein